MKNSKKKVLERPQSPQQIGTGDFVKCQLCQEPAEHFKSEIPLCHPCYIQVATEGKYKYDFRNDAESLTRLVRSWNPAIRGRATLSVGGQSCYPGGSSVLLTINLDPVIMDAIQHGDDSKLEISLKDTDVEWLTRRLHLARVLHWAVEGERAPGVKTPSKVEEELAATQVEEELKLAAMRVEEDLAVMRVTDARVDEFVGDDCRVRFSVFEVKLDDVPVLGKFRVIRDNDWGEGVPFCSEILDSPTWLHLCQLADQAIAQTGDHHHIFLEGLDREEDGPDGVPVYSFNMGS